MDNPILAPAAILILWSILVLLWMAVGRLKAMKTLGMDLSKAPAGGRGHEVDAKVPPPVAWRSHNYTHLMEQPTLFYAVVAILAISGAGAGINVTLAWGYVALRIAHSIWQTTINTIPIRFLLFLLSTLCLLALAVNAVMATI